jgi:SNF2 family DNA or RNA helicase
MRYAPHDYQRFAIDWLTKLTLVDGESGGALLLDPGLGKTSITLSWVVKMLQAGLAKKVLVIAPLRVIYTVWPEECHKWDQFRHLKISIIHGDVKRREAAVQKDADLYLINPEGVPWLQRYFSKEHPFDILAVDESTKFKNWSAKRTTSLKRLLPFFDYRVILTGTPSPNTIVDMFSQMFIVDLGKSLGTKITSFRNRFCYRGGYGGYKWIPYETSQTVIERMISKRCLRLDEEDHLDLPELLINDVKVELPAPARKLYRKWEREMYIALERDETLTASNAGAKYAVCRQLANGGFYKQDEETGQRTTTHVHSAKVDAAVDLIDELQGKPVMVVYQFHQDLDRIRQEIPDIPAINGDTSAALSKATINKWNEGKLRYLAVQPQSASHGVNLQKGPGRDVIWFGLTDDLECYLQMNKRIHRQGVTGQVRIHRILARGTVDTAIAARLQSKDRSQTALLQALKEHKHA